MKNHRDPENDSCLKNFVGPKTDPCGMGGFVRAKDLKSVDTK